MGARWVHVQKLFPFSVMRGLFGMFGIIQHSRQCPWVSSRDGRFAAGYVKTHACADHFSTDSTKTKSGFERTMMPRSHHDSSCSRRLRPCENASKLDMCVRSLAWWL